MPSSDYMNDGVTFYIGHHETRRPYDVTDEVLHHAQDCNYDMITAPITNDSFHSRVLTILSSHLAALEETGPSSRTISGQVHVPPTPVISSLTPSDTCLTPSDNIAQLILLASRWIDLASPDPLIAELSRQVLVLEISFASFCGATNVIIQGPPLRAQGFGGDGLAQYARAIQDALGLGAYLQIHLRLPMYEYAIEEALHDIGDLGSFARERYMLGIDQNRKTSGEALKCWEIWHGVRSVCRYSARLSIDLLIPKIVPPPQYEMRWFSEPLRILELESTSFRQNAKGIPSLTSAQKRLVHRYMRLRNPPWILLNNVGSLPGFESGKDASNVQDGALPSKSVMSASRNSPSDPTPAEASKQAATSPGKRRTDVHQHLKYMRDLQTKQPAKPPIERFGAGYQDYLQNPLQPLTDNLESITYEVFEKDPVKYDWYERAITCALHDWETLGKKGSAPNGRVIVAVVGAGRGPLVTRALQASAASGVEIEMWAIEKNHNAYVLLQRHNLTKWDQRVHLVQSDMRSWAGPQYAAQSKSPILSRSESNLEQRAPRKFVFIDILVSELLGSFADNELSPECLDGVQHLLNPVHGISIPTSYTAHLTPIAAPKLHADISARAASGVSDAAQIPYVVMLHAIDYLCTQTPTAESGERPEPIPIIEQVWEFKHPVPPLYLQRPLGDVTTAPGNDHNRRFARLEFRCQHRGVCHGLAGYFETVLYDPQQGRAVSGIGDEKIELSTNPLTIEQKSRDMISWFPIFFPLKTPIYFPPNALLVISIWRQTDGRKVWYEWMVESFMLFGAQLPGFEDRVRLGGSELHSSIGNACLM